MADHRRMTLRKGTPMDSRTNVPVEQLSGTGVLWDGTSRVGEYRYQLEVARERQRIEDLSGGRTVPDEIPVGGRLLTGGDWTQPFWGLDARPLTLQLEDGRKFDCVLDARGRLFARGSCTLRR